MNRREMLKKSLFGGLTIAGAGTVVDAITMSNEHIIETEGYKATKSAKPGAICMAYGDVWGSKDFPIRPLKAQASDGSLIYFLWPSERGDARGYLEFATKQEVDVNHIVFRLRMSEPEAPYYLHWRSGNYYMYTPPGALIHRASWLMEKGEPDATLQALSDIRFAVLLNLTIRGDGQAYLNELADLDLRVREYSNLEQFWDEYKRLLTETNPR